MAKQLSYRDDARRALLKGVDALQIPLKLPLVPRGAMSY